jgi:hypothetical protein
MVADQPIIDSSGFNFIHIATHNSLVQVRERAPRRSCISHSCVTLHILQVALNLVVIIVHKWREAHGHVLSSHVSHAVTSSLSPCHLAVLLNERRLPIDDPDVTHAATSTHRSMHQRLNPTFRIADERDLTLVHHDTSADQLAKLAHFH